MTSHEVADVLRRVRHLLDDPARLASGHLAVDAEGEGRRTDDDSAVAWCLLGATFRCGGKVVDVLRPLIETCREVIGRDAVDVNDALGHSEVLRVLDTCLERISAERG